MTSLVSCCIRSISKIKEYHIIFIYKYNAPKQRRRGLSKVMPATIDLLKIYKRYIDVINIVQKQFGKQLITFIVLQVIPF